MKLLFNAILTLKTEAELASFFRDLLTPAELEEFTNRWQAVKLLLQGKPYAAIAQDLGMSTTTVTRVAHWLSRGTGGYQTAARRQGLVKTNA